MTTAMSDQKLAVDSGQWLLYRYNPDRSLAGENPLTLDSHTPTGKVKEFLQQQTRFQMLTKSKPENAQHLWAQAQQDAEIRYRMYEYLAQRKNELPGNIETKAGETTGHTVGSH
jgi:pyruvate-ferredoxin/flavodoxin oxidoreductase